MRGFPGLPQGLAVTHTRAVLRRQVALQAVKPWIVRGNKLLTCSIYVVTHLADRSRKPGRICCMLPGQRTSQVDVRHRPEQAATAGLLGRSSRSRRPLLAQGLQPEPQQPFLSLCQLSASDHLQHNCRRGETGLGRAAQAGQHHHAYGVQG